MKSVYSLMMLVVSVSLTGHSDQDKPLAHKLSEVSRGEHVSLTFGCTNSCHGADASGKSLWKLDDGSQIVAPSLHEALRKYSSDEFERLVRHGVRPDGTHLLGAMPSYAFSSMSDSDLNALTAYFRSLPRSKVLTPALVIGPTLRAQIEAGQPPNPNQEVQEGEEHLQVTPDTELGLGRYLARNTCGECHGVNLEGAGNQPDLRVVAAYDYPAFEMLIKQGVSVDQRQLGLMKIVAERRFSRFTERESKAIYKYLRSRVEGLGSE